MAYILGMTWLSMCALVGYVGRNRALGFWGFFLLCLFTGPFLSILLLVLTARRPKGI
jgi:hypothetical protein